MDAGLAERAGLRYAFNWDSPGFVRLVVRYPRGFLEVEWGRQLAHRPLYPTLGWLLYRPLRPLGRWVPEDWTRQVQELAGRGHQPEQWTGLDPGEVVVAWGALVAVNLTLCWLALWLVLGALRECFPPRLALCLTLIPAAHPDTVDYLLVPHTAAFDLLVPALVLFLASRAWPRGRSGLLPAAVLGLALLGKELVWALGNVAAEALRSARRDRRHILMPLLAAGPVALCAALVLQQGLPLEHWETWLLRRSVGLGVLDHLQAMGMGFLVPLATGATALLLLPRPAAPQAPLPAGLARHLALYAGCTAAFWCVVGYHPVRLSMTHFPWVVVLLGRILAARSRRPHLWALAALVGFAMLRGLGHFHWY
ncbi:MAG: hypothetical protein HY722_01150 [Planctomycetes bacterium]|nr:hypothetical protein [Planctomycetota bacterium]